MAEKNGTRPVLMVVGALILIGGVIAVVTMSGGEPSEENATEVEGDEAPRAQKSRPSREPTDRSPRDAKIPRTKVKAPINTSETHYLVPHRFLARYGDRSRRDPGRTREAAEELAQQVRRRAQAGENPVTLISELSDPPLRIPNSVVAPYRDLEPGAVSPVVPVEGGFAVFIGFDPEELASSADAGQQ